MTSPREVATGEERGQSSSLKQGLGTYDSVVLARLIGYSICSFLCYIKRVYPVITKCHVYSDTTDLTIGVAALNFPTSFSVYEKQETLRKWQLLRSKLTAALNSLLQLQRERSQMRAQQPHLQMRAQQPTKCSDRKIRFHFRRGNETILKMAVASRVYTHHRVRNFSFRNAHSPTFE